MTCDERQGENRVRENFMHGLVDEASPVSRKLLLPREFTLIELLIVIAIMAILSSMLFPGLMRAKDNARKILCVNNLKTSGSAITCYNSDFDAYYPLSYNVGTERWYKTVCDLGYLEMKHYNNVNANPAVNDSVFICSWDYAIIDNKYLNYGGYRGSYGPNCNIFLQKTSGNPVSNYKMTNLKAYSKTLLLGESAVNHNPYASREQADLNIPNNTYFGYPERWKHNRIQNLLFADIHVAGINYSENSKVILVP